jgi:hypothetical protein
MLAIPHLECAEQGSRSLVSHQVADVVLRLVPVVVSQAGQLEGYSHLMMVLHSRGHIQASRTLHDATHNLLLLAAPACLQVSSNRRQFCTEAASADAHSALPCAQCRPL